MPIYLIPIIGIILFLLIFLSFWGLLEAHVSLITAYGKWENSSDHTPFSTFLNEAYQRAAFSPLVPIAHIPKRVLITLLLYSLIFPFGLVLIWNADKIDDEDEDPSRFTHWCVRRITCGKVGL